MLYDNDLYDRSEYLFIFITGAGLTPDKLRVQMSEVEKGNDKEYYLEGYRDGYKQPRNFKYHVPADLAGQIIEMLNKITIPLTPDWIMGMDGDRYQLVVQRGFNGIELRWWSEVPKQWHQVEKFINIIYQFLEKHIPDVR